MSRFCHGRRRLTISGPRHPSTPAGGRFGRGELSKPKTVETLAAPRDDGVRFDDAQSRAPLVPGCTKPSPQEPVEPIELRSVHRALQYAKLVAEGDDLKLQCRSSSKSRHRGRKQRRQYGRRRELTRVGNFHFISQIGNYGKECRCEQKRRHGVFAASERGREGLKQGALFGIVRNLILGVPLDRQNVPPRGEFDGFDSSVFRVTGADLEPACKSRYRLVVP